MTRWPSVTDSPEGGDLDMGIRKSRGKNKKSKRPAAAAAANRAETLRKAAAPRKRTKAR